MALQKCFARKGNRRLISAGDSGRYNLLPADLAAFVLFFDPANSATFRNIAMLQLGGEISGVHRASPGVLVGSKYFLDKRLEARVAAN